MRPTSLTVRGLKCWDDKTLELPRLLAIQGPNGSGKTALIQAIRLALLGYDPETGKQLNQTRKLVAPDVSEAEIGLSFDTGFGIRRRFGEKSDTQVLPPRGERNGRECQERINEETGGLVVSLDLGEFLAKSDDKRRGWLFEHLPRDAAELDWKTFAEWTDGEEGALSGVVRALWDTCVMTAPNAVVGLGSAIEVAHRDFLEADRDRLNQEKVVARGTEIERALDEPSAVPKGFLKELQDRRGVLDQRIGTARAGSEARESIEARRATAEDKLASAMRELDHCEKVRASVVEQVTELPDVFTADAIKHLEDLALAAEQSWGTARARWTEASTDTARVEQERAHLGGRLEELTDVAADGCQFADLGCTTDTSALVNVKLEELEAEMKYKKGEVARFVEIEKDRKVRVDELVTEEDAAKRDLDSALSAIAERDTLERSAAHHLTTMQELRERCGIYRTSKEEAEQELDGPFSGGDALAGLYVDRDTIDEEIANLLKDIDAGTRYRTTIEGFKREVDVLDERGEKAKDLKELDGNLRRLRAHVIQMMIAPLWAEANVILRAMDATKTFRFIFERENKAILDFGFEEDGVLRLHAAASKGERAMLAVAFVGALIGVMAPPMRLLVIDDVEQLDPVRRLRLMTGIAKLRDRFDTVIIAGACDFDALEGWEIEVLGQVEAAVA